jgi:hypothetical protein
MLIVKLLIIIVNVLLVILDTIYIIINVSNVTPIVNPVKVHLINVHNVLKENIY